MGNALNEIEMDIGELCLEMVKLLKRAKEEGIIRDDEYKDLIRKKVGFLNRE